MQVNCGAQGAVLVEIYREPGDLLGLGLARWAVCTIVIVTLLYRLFYLW